MRLSRRTQSAIEYLSIIGIAMTLLIPSTLLFLSYSRSTNDEVISRQLNLIGSTLLSKAEEMYVLGEGSWVTVDVNMPDSFRSAAINSGTELAFVYANSNGEGSAVFFAERFTVTNTASAPDPDPCLTTCALDLRPGMNSIRIESTPKGVAIRRMN